ncbi:hypothetical protein [Azorhizophilus paspali]|uniref:Uncharacterized protein n=1 Tax=Azorhizophilus paspali TaxID=69963 RepID=A0ABV6SNW9_AZOPA
MSKATIKAGLAIPITLALSLADSVRVAQEERPISYSPVAITEDFATIKECLAGDKSSLMQT